MKAKEIKRKYEKIDKDYGSSGRNLYSCSEGHTTLITHIDRGTTPMFLKCPGCGARAVSHMYNIPQVGPLIVNNDLVAPDYNKFWYRPTLEDTLAIRSEYELEHVLAGGLLYRGSEEPRKAKRRRLPRKRR